MVLIIAIGVSNFLAHHVQALTEDSEIKPMVNQIEYHPGFGQMGNSQGGLVTALTAAKHRDEIRAVILIYPAFSIYDDVHEMFESLEEIPAAHSLLGLRLGRKYFVDIWDQEPYGKIKEYGKNILLIHGDRDSIVPVAYPWWRGMWRQR